MGTPNNFKIFKRVAGQDFKLKEKQLSTTAINYRKPAQIQGLLASYVALLKIEWGGEPEVNGKVFKLRFFLPVTKID